MGFKSHLKEHILNSQRNLMSFAKFSLKVVEKDQIKGADGCYQQEKHQRINIISLYFVFLKLSGLNLANSISILFEYGW